MGTVLTSNLAILPSPLDKTQLRRAWVVATCVAIGIGIYYVAIKGEDRSAFNRWRPLVAQLLAGEDIYLSSAFPTPPVMALVLYPFSQLPGKWAMASWFAFKVLLTAAVVRWMFQAIWKEGLPWWAAPVALALCARPIIGDLLHGNVNLWILFLVIGAFVAFRSNRDLLSGVLLALAIACKLTPALVLVYFAWKRAWSVVLATIAGLFLWLILVPGSLLGFAQNQQLLVSWTKLMIVPFVAEGNVDTEQVNQSLPGLVHRLLTPSMAIKPDDGRSIIQANIADVDQSVVHGVTIGLSILILASLAVACRTPMTDRRDLRLFHELTIVLFAALLLSERSWKHHYTALVPSYFLLISAVFEANGARILGMTRNAWICILIVLSAMALVGTSKDLMTPFFGPEGSKWVQVYGAYLWATAALVLAHGMAMRSIGHNQANATSATTSRFAETTGRETLGGVLCR